MQAGGTHESRAVSRIRANAEIDFRNDGSAEESLTKAGGGPIPKRGGTLSSHQGLACLRNTARKAAFRDGQEVRRGLVGLAARTQPIEQHRQNDNSALDDQLPVE
jgi:hypothetical protein